MHYNREGFLRIINEKLNFFFRFYFMAFVFLTKICIIIWFYFSWKIIYNTNRFHCIVLNRFYSSGKGSVSELWCRIFISSATTDICILIIQKCSLLFFFPKCCFDIFCFCISCCQHPKSLINENFNGGGSFAALVSALDYPILIWTGSWLLLLFVKM